MAGTTVNPYRFGGQAGYYRDSLTRQYVRARSLDIPKGRWCSQDPYGSYEADWNKYWYVKNNPVNKLDASGFISITIDDAPHLASTQKLLDAFHKFNLKVGFFVIGKNVNAWNSGLISILRATENHRVGNHSMTHPQPFCPPEYMCGKNQGKASESMMFCEWSQCHTTVKTLTGFDMNILRSPGGAGWQCCPKPVAQSIADVNNILGTHYYEVQGSGADDNPKPNWAAIQTCFTRRNGNPHTCPAWRQFLNEIDRAVQEHRGGNIIFHDDAASPSAADFMVSILSYIQGKWGLDPFNG